jgi:hypothetical protein
MCEKERKWNFSPKQELAKSFGGVDPSKYNLCSAIKVTGLKDNAHKIWTKELYFYH